MLRTLMKAFIESQFNYCPLTWMFHSRKLNNKINKLHERTLRLVYKNPNLSFQELLTLDNSFCIHHRNLQKLTIEMYKAKTKTCPTLFQELFPVYENSYNLETTDVGNILMLEQKDTELKCCYLEEKKPGNFFLKL